MQDEDGKPPDPRWIRAVDIVSCVIVCAFALAGRYKIADSIDDFMHPVLVRARARARARRTT